MSVAALCVYSALGFALFSSVLCVVALRVREEQTTYDRQTRFDPLVNVAGGLCVAAAICVLCTGVLAAVVIGGRAAGATICRNFGIQSGFPTKMVVLNWSDAGTCLARTPDGRWVPNTQIQQFVNGSVR